MRDFVKKWRRDRAARKTKTLSRNFMVRIEPLEPRILLAVYHVNTLADAPVSLTDGDTTFRDAVAMANMSDEADIIEFDSALFSEDAPSRYLLTEGEISVESEIAVNAPADRTLIFDAQTLSRVFFLQGSGARLTLSNLAIENGSADYGGAVYADGGSLCLTEVAVRSCAAANSGGALFLTGGTSAVLRDAVFDSNTAGWYGGAVYAQGADLSVYDSVVSNNRAGYDGGGIAQYGGSLLISLSTLRGNRAISGGGLINFGTAVVSGSLFADNLAYTESNVPGHLPLGGGIANFGTVKISSSTLAGNTAAGVGAVGGGICHRGASLELINSIVAVNTAVSGADIDSQSSVTGRYVLSSWNGWDDDSSGTLIYDPDRPLFSLSEPLSGRLCLDSQAVDAGSNELAALDGFAPDSLDLAGGPRYSGGSIDLGAFEYSYDIDETLVAEIGKAAYTVQEGCSFFLTSSTNTQEDVVYWWDYGNGNFVRGPASGWVSLRKLGLAAGTYTIRLRLENQEGSFSRTVSASLTVLAVAPSFSVKKESFADGRILKIEISAYFPSGQTPFDWILDWGDGTGPQTIRSLSDSLTAAYCYEKPEHDSVHVVTLELPDSPSHESNTKYAAARHTVPGTNRVALLALPAERKKRFGLLADPIDSVYADAAFEPAEIFFEPEFSGVGLADPFFGLFE